MIWRLTYCNKKGVEARIDIIRGNSTPVEIVQGSGQPFTLAYKLDKNDKSGHIMTSSADIEIFETETFNIDDLKTSNETELKVEYFEDDVLTWEGFILPDFFSREIGSPNIVRMTASDRLTALKGVTLSDLPSRISLRSLIELSLDQTGLSLGLVSQIQINQGSTNILDSEVLSQRLTDVRGRSINCHDILMSIMVGTHSTIRQRAGQWQVYNKLEHELRTPTIFFDKVERGAIRTIQPVASIVGVYNEFGGGRSYPDNYDFSDGLTGWTAVNGFSAGLNNKEVTGYTGGVSNFVPIYGDSVETNSVINKNASFSTSSSPYLKSENIGVSYPDNDSVNITVEVNATGVGSFITNSFVEFAIIATNTVTSKTLSLSNAGIFETMDANAPHLHRIKFPTVTSFYNASTGSLQVEGALIAGDENSGDYNVHVRIYGSGESRTSFINSATIKFSVGGDSPKGNLYKTTQGSNYTKLHDVETVIFGDYIRGGINGHFYYYPIDDTSNLYLPSGELSSPIWKTFFDTTERPLLHHVSRQKSRLFSVAHDILRANINVDSFDPLAVFQDCKGGKYVVVSSSFDFLRSEVDVELEQIAYDDTILKRDFIYSYFGDGEDTIKSIGGIAGGGGTGGGGGSGMTNDQVAILNDVAKLAHLHENKEIIDQITQDMVDNASHEIVISTDTETELTDENILSALRVLGEIAKNNEAFLEDLKERFLSKIEPDTAQKLITFVEGIEVGEFTTGALGGGAAVKMIDGTSYAEVDNLTVRQKATFRELIIESLKHIGGQLVLTPARMKCVRVVDGGTFYKCYFDTGDGEVSNEFVAGDYARCQVFTGSGTKFYWRLVTLVGDDWINLSKTSAAVGSDAPEAGDDIAQLGNATDTSRQSAIILSTVGIDAPSWKQYSGINTFSLEGKETTVFSKLGNRIQGETVFTSGGANLDDHLDGVAQDILDALQAAQDADDKAQQAIEDAEADVAIINTEIGRLQDQIDGKVSNWYYAYSPTLSNYPASDWTTNEIKDSHIGDTFTNTEPAPAENAGKSWRFIKDGSTYSWIVISDSDALKALQEASKAQATADGKSTTYLFQPTKYKLGDMWVLNADQTVNGTLYKQGDLLTATQDSETFVQAHWLKRIRYTDDTKIDNLEIGGRNYVRKEILTNFRAYSSAQISYEWVDFEEAPNTTSIRIKGSAGDTTNIGWIWLSSLRLNEGDIVSAKYTIKNNATTPINISTRLKIPYINFTLQPGEVYYFKDEGFPLRKDRLQFGLQDIDDELDISLGGFVVNKGNKATDWTPAPEDVEANIETAKTEAENAAKEYANTKAEAERVIAEAYADDIVTDEEQARIDDVNDKLALAKEYAEAQDALLKIQQEAYADGEISKAEQAAIQAAEDYADLKKTEAQAYADGIVSDEEARAIADALAKFNESKAHAEQLVKDIEIGGANLLSGLNREYYLNNTETSTTNIIREDFNFKRNSEYVISYDIKGAGQTSFVVSGYTRPISTIASDGQTGDGAGGLIAFQLTSEWRRIWIKIKTANWSDEEYSKPIGIRAEADSEVSIRDIMLVSGNKAFDWTPAPEDVEASIETAKTEAEQAAKDHADIKAEAERVLAEAYADDIVTAEEQARIDDVNDKLAAAKAYAEAQDALLKTQQEAYADGAISTAEQAAIDAAKDYADLKKTEAQAYADGIVSDEEARAIADALAKFNESKAHAEQLVKDIEIGGRNLFKPFNDWYTVNNEYRQLRVEGGVVFWKQLTTSSHPQSIAIYNYDTYSRDYTFSYKTNAPVGLIRTSLYQGSHLNPQSTIEDKGDYRYVILKFTAELTSNSIRWYGMEPAEPIEEFAFWDFKFEKGNKATDWSPAPEDVEASIETAKTEAESAANAYALQKAEAERVLAEAYADDIVTAEEQARIDDVNNKLALAKEYAEAQDALLKIQQEAYADEHISTAEQAAITAAQDYADLKKTEAEAYADDIVTAEEARAIADALEKYNASKAHAESLVDNLVIGGRNYLLNSDFSKGLDEYWGRLNSSPQENFEIIGTELKVTFNTGTKSDFGRTNFIQENKLEGQEYITISSSIKGTGSLRIRFGSSSMPLQTIDNEEFKIVVFTIPKSNFGNGSLIIEISAGELTFNKIKAEAGNKATDWTPAPEDTERELLESQGYMKARYIRDYLNGSSANARNHWVQITALNKEGTNIALNKPVTASDTVTNLERVTNGNMDVGNYALSSEGNQYVQIDLGQVYYDIDNITAYHYWEDNREYNGTKTQISEDGITWKTIFDSAVSGTYVETEGGKVHTQRYASVMDRIAETEAKTRFQTLIDGGLIYTALMKLFDTISGDETAFISGKQGSGKNLPAFGAGGTYAEALEGTAKAIIRHDGTVKFTDADIKGIINAISGKIGGLTIKDGKLLIGDVGDHRIELDASSRKMIFTAYDDFTAGSIGFDAGGAILDLFKRYTGSSAWSSSVRLDGDSFLLKKIGLSDAVTITPTKIKITNGSNTTEILDDGVYVNGVKLTGGGGGYTHPSTHSADMISAGTFAGIVKANNNTSYTTKQVRNMILSTNDANSSQMANGDIWIKYE